MKRAATFAVLIFAAAAALYLLRGKSAPDAAPSSVSVATGTATGTAAAPVTLPPGASVPKAEVAPAFVNFLAEDAKLLDSMHVDAAREEARENEMAARMGAAEVEYARQIALNAKAPANLRILAADLLGRAAPALAGAAQDDLITRAMNSARAAPHSTDELSNVQAKAMALMEVDAIADRAAKDPAERDHLLRLESQATDSTIRKHIQERLAGLPHP